MQRDTFLNSEGDAYYERNSDHSGAPSRPLVSSLRALEIKPKRILEIGCSDGRVLEILKAAFSSECHGIDPSREAVEVGRKRASGVHLAVGTADRLDFEDNFFDLVIFGFCLYLCDPQDHFRIAAEANRVLQNGGFLVILDFHGSPPHRNEYRYRPGVFSFKMDYSGMFLWHPSYRLLSRAYSEHATPLTLSRDEAVVMNILHKDMTHAFPSALGMQARRSEDR